MGSLTALTRHLGYGSRLDDSAVPRLLELLRDGPAATRFDAAFALEEFRESPQRDAIVEGLLAALYDDHRPVRRRAARTLWILRDSRMQSVLVRWLDSPDDADRSCARTCLVPIGTHGDPLAVASGNAILDARREPPRPPAPTVPTVPPLPLDEFLAGRHFPPSGPVPQVSPADLPALRSAACGNPGDPVRPGLFPRTPVKLARLVLASAGDYPAASVREAAATGYAKDRPYIAHDALACALVHPEVDATDLALEYGRSRQGQRGWRSRRKTHHVLAWARTNGYLPAGADCLCAHGWFSAPRTRNAASAMSVHWYAIKNIRTLVASDESRWIRLWQCTHCGEHLAEDCVSTGQVEFYFGYPVDSPAIPGHLVL